ncbi:putative mating channel protein [Staphylococcus aureus]|nr:putative mating channel protein [Staphylococcus aureus]
MKIISKYILTRFSKNGKHFDIPKEQRRVIPKFKNRRKMIVICFYSLLAILLILLLASFIKATRANNDSKEAVNKTNMIQKKYEDNANTVQYSPKLKLYADKFIDTYMNISKDSKELESREKELLKYFPSDYKKPDEKISDTERKLNSKEFYNIKRKDKQTIIQYIVNYDVNITEKKEVKVKKKKKSEKDKDRIDNILKLDYDKKSEKELDDIVKDEVEKKNNKYMTQGYVFQKLAISVIGFIITLFMSIVFLSISFAKLIFSTFALFLFLFLVFSWIVSFIPGFELSVFSAFAKTLGYIILSACMTFLFVIVGLCIKLANSFIEPDSQNAYFLNSIFIIVILFVMYKKRAQIINFVSRGNISFSPSAIGAGVMNRTQERFNKIRHEQAQNKKAKRENQRDEPAPPLQNDNDLRRRQQDKPMPLFINKDNQKNGNKRREQQESMNGNDVKSASVESNANNYSKQPQKASQQEHQVRETRQRKDIQRSPQVVNQPLNNENHSINRKEQKSVQTAYDTDVQKRQIQNATQNQQSRQSGNRNQPITRNYQSKDRLKEQKDINKHGK